MNRKSTANGLRKSVKPRESHLPGSAGLPLSARGGFGNRTLLETTRNSVGGSRVSLYGPPKAKESRCFNEDFIQLTFRRLRDFLTQRHIVSEMPTSPKMTSRQFESLFLTLMRYIDSSYNPPTGNNWLEFEVPVVMEAFGYPQKVMKSTLQTISSKVGPIMGIIDYLIDLATGLDCDRQEAVRLLSRDESPLQIDLQIEQLAHSTFAKGVTVDSQSIRDLISEFCARHKGIGDEDQIRQECQRKLALKEESEATLQALEEQLAEMKSVQEECVEHVQFIEQMKLRKQGKQDELRESQQQIASIREKIANLEQLIVGTRKTVSLQSISQEDIRRIRAEQKGLSEQIGVAQQKINLANAHIENLHKSIRIQQASVDSTCTDIAQSLVPANILETKESLVQVLDHSQETESFLARLTVEYESLTKRIARIQNELDLRMFDLNQRKSQLKTAVEFATQDKEALDEKISYFEARLTRREADILRKRQALKNSDNLITFTEREVEDLKIELGFIQEQLKLAENKFELQKFQQARAERFAKFYGLRIERVIQKDRERMEALVRFYWNQNETLACEQTAEALLHVLNDQHVIEYFKTCENIS